MSPPTQPASQKGKFKPRRPTPQRRSTSRTSASAAGDGSAAATSAAAAAASDATAATNDSSSTNHVAFAPGTAPGAPPYDDGHGGGRGGRGRGRGRGRGGGRGRGRGRHGSNSGGGGGRGGRGRGDDMPRGEVFFTSDMSGDGQPQDQTQSGTTASPVATSSPVNDASSGTRSKKIPPGSSRITVGSSRSRDASFTSDAVPAPVPSSASSIAEERRRNKAAMDISEEEIVGVMETGVGGLREDGDTTTTNEQKKKSRTKIKKEKTDDDLDGYADDDADVDSPTRTRSARSSSKAAAAAAADYDDMDLYGILYDSSDSSGDEADEEASNGARSRRDEIIVDDDDDSYSKHLEPMELPFPTNSSTQIATPPVPFSASLPSSSSEQGISTQQNVLSDENSWMLMQLPTRLPSLKQQQQHQQATSDGTSMNIVIPEQSTSSSQVASGGNVGDGAGHSASNDGTSESYYSEVVTSPIKTDGFDNQLQNAAPGKLGKIQVYKSGKMVLVMDNPNGGPEIRMELNEGLSCNFRQDVVDIDTDKGNFVALGNVSKSIVASPDLDALMMQ